MAVEEPMSRAEILRFVDKYPGLQHLLRGNLRESVSPGDDPIPRTRIAVQRMDEHLFFFHGILTNLTQISEDKTMYGYEVQKVWIFDHADKLRAWTAWEQYDGRAIRDLIIDKIDPDIIGYIMKQTTRHWSLKLKPVFNDPTDSLAKIEHITDEVVIYIPPKKGTVRDLLRQGKFSEHARLTTRFMSSRLIQQDPPMIAIHRNFLELADRFERLVYNQGLRSLIDRSKNGSMQGVYGGVTMLSYVMCGRVRLTLRKGADQVTFQAYQNGSPKMCLFSIDATFGVASRIAGTVIDAFVHSPYKAARCMKERKTYISV